MNKNKITALIFALIAFIAFYWGFLDFENGSNLTNLAGFVIAVSCTFASIFIGNVSAK